MSGARRGVVCAGCWCADRIKRIDAWPEQDTLARIVDIYRHGGGCAHNVAHDLKRLDPDLPVEAIGLLGRDADGDFLYDGALAAGIDVRQLHRSDDVQTSFTDVMTVTATGRRTFFHHQGSDDALTPEHFDFTTTRARMLHLGLLGVHATLDGPWRDDPNGWVAVLRDACRAGLHRNLELVSIDPEQQRTIALPCLPLVDSLIVNDHEIGALADIVTVRDGITDEAACERAARRVASLGPIDPVIVHWPGGALALGGDGRALRRAAEPLAPDAIVGAVGAGDAFAAGALLVLHDGGSLEEALALGHRTAAASLGAPDAVSGVGRRVSG